MFRVLPRWGSAVCTPCLSVLVVVALLTGCPQPPPLADAGTSTPPLADAGTLPPPVDEDTSTPPPADVDTSTPPPVDVGAPIPPPPQPKTNPAVTLDSSVPDPTHVASIPVTVEFSEWVQGFEPWDVETLNCTVTNFKGGGSTYKFEIVPEGEGLVSVHVPADAAMNAEESGNEASIEFTRMVDLTPPTGIMTSTATHPTTESPIHVSVTFSEPVTGFDADDVEPVNATVDNFTGAGDAYAFDLTPITDGIVSARLPEGRVHDIAGNANNDSAQITRAFTLNSNVEAIIDVNNEPWLAGAAVSSTRAYAPMAVFFEGWRSTPREDVVEYLWDFGDGSPTFSGFNAANVYETPGAYLAQLTVIDKHGWVATDSVVIEVLARNGTTYYVDAEQGNDNSAGTGTGNAAWRTAARAFSNTYQPGDEILFKRGQVFPFSADSFDGYAWRGTHGYRFAAYGDGAKPMFKLAGANVATVFPNPRYVAHITFQDLQFDLTNDQGNAATLVQMTQEAQNIMFLRCDVWNCNSAMLMQNDVSGAFIVDCTVYDSRSMQIYATCSRLALLDNYFDLSANHIAYLEVVDKGVFARNTFSRPTFGRHALRVSGRDGPITNNVVITDNHIRGWMEPGAGRYNWLLVHIAPNTASLQFIRDIVFKNNTVEDGGILLNIGNCENVLVHDNVFSSVDTYEARRIIIGSAHGFDTMPNKNIRFTNNIINVAPSDVGTTSVFSILTYDNAPFEGRYLHENITIEKNVIAMAGGVSRLLWFETLDLDQVAQVKTDNQVIYVEDQNAALYQVGGTLTNPANLFSLSQWRDATGNDPGSQIYDSFAWPVPGWASAPASVVNSPIPVTYEGAFAITDAGLREVRLWVRKDSDTWADTGLATAGNSGNFLYTPPAGADGVYRFALQAIDNADNTSPPPQGNGHCQTVYTTFN
ncbi:MAG: PKD domain-containing protein [Nitrospiraceae bacterium]|nr:PKD domain-containing protein [Nitrospiraceae bacterium]